jgi:hypothetical protein
MKRRKHNWPHILKDFDQSNLSIPKYAKTHKIAESSLYRKLQERSDTRSHMSNVMIASEGVHEITLQSSTAIEVESSKVIFQIKTTTLDLNFYDLPTPKWLAEVLKVCK